MTNSWNFFDFVSTIRLFLGLFSFSPTLVKEKISYKISRSRYSVSLSCLVTWQVTEQSWSTWRGLCGAPGSFTLHILTLDSSFHLVSNFCCDFFLPSPVAPPLFVRLSFLSPVESCALSVVNMGNAQASEEFFQACKDGHCGSCLFLFSLLAFFAFGSPFSFVAFFDSHWPHWLAGLVYIHSLL